MSFIVKRLALETNTIIISTIHQPNFETFSLFDDLLLLAGGQVMYNGPTQALDGYLTSLGSPTARHANPADHAIELVNTEFYSSSLNGLSAQEHLDDLAGRWKSFSHSDKSVGVSASPATSVSNEGKSRSTATSAVADGVRKTIVLSRRNLKNYSRNLLAYGVRLAMHIGMGVLLALVWMRLGTSSDKINDRLSVHFFSVAFLGFMSVSGIPAFLEVGSDVFEPL